LFSVFLTIHALNNELVKQETTNRCGGEKRDSDLRNLWVTIRFI
jgi:hypothetical protein